MLKPELDLFEHDGTCVAETRSGPRCKKSVNEIDRISATRMIHGSYSGIQDQSLDKTLVDRIFALLQCGIHRKLTSEATISESLQSEYQAKFRQWVLDHESLPELELHRSRTGINSSVGDKLLDWIEIEEAAWGAVYVFTCADLPDMVKVGYVGNKSDTTARLSKWRKCHAGLKEMLRSECTFPHRVEELVHRELGWARYDILCPVSSCPHEKHDEWFQCSIEKACETVKSWSTLMNMHTLYDTASRRFSPTWQTTTLRMVNSNVEVTSKGLLDDFLGEGRRIRDLTDQFAAASIDCDESMTKRIPGLGSLF